MSTEEKTEGIVCIVGAGLSGLICGVRLAKAGYTVHIVEELTYSGGLLAFTRIGKEYLELLPHHIRKTDKALLSLIREQGLDGKLEWFDSLWYGKASRKKLGYLSEGFAGLINSLIQDIVDNGGHIHYSTTLTDITKLDGQENDHACYRLTCVLSNAAHSYIDCDYVIYTGSCRAFVNVSHNLPIPINTRDQLMNITYSACISLMTVLKRQHSEVYFQSTPSADLPFSRIINHSNCFGQRDYGGNVVYLVGNCSITDSLWVASDRDIMEKYFHAFRKLYPMIKKTDIKAWRLTKIRYACADVYPREELINPLENLYVCADGLYKYNTDEKPLNRMEHVVQLANNVTSQIIRKTEEKGEAYKEDASLITPIA